MMNQVMTDAEIPRSKTQLRCGGYENRAIRPEAWGVSGENRRRANGGMHSIHIAGPELAGSKFQHVAASLDSCLTRMNQCQKNRLPQSQLF
jgi:hypothetical protein